MVDTPVLSSLLVYAEGYGFQQGWGKVEIMVRLKWQYISVQGVQGPCISFPQNVSITNFDLMVHTHNFGLSEVMYFES